MKKLPDSNYTKKVNQPSISKPIETVGQLKQLLSHYPDQLPLTLDGNSITLVWYNIGTPGEHLSLEEVG